MNNSNVNTLLKSFWTNLLINSLNCFGVDSSWPVLDCCAGDTSLVFSLMEHFTEVSSNDLSKNCPTQTHCDVTNQTYWAAIKGKYAGIVTEPPQDLAIMFNIINNSRNIGIQFCAFMVDVEYEKILDTARVLSPLLIVSVKSLKMNILLCFSTPILPSTQCIHFGAEIIQLWRSDPTTFKVTVTRKVTDSCVKSLAEEDEVKMLGNGNGDQGQAEKSIFDKQRDTEPLQPLPLKLFGSPSDQGRILQNFIAALRTEMSKRSVIENVYKMPYRSAQRKIRLAKYIDKYPEMNQMTQREAERYLAKTIECDKSDRTRRRKIKQ